MKALTFDRYTGPSGLQWNEVPEPECAPDQVLIRVERVGLNAWDWHQYQGKPLFMRAEKGWKVKDTRVVGADFAGTVEQVGHEVPGVSPGDRVVASTGLGALAPLATASAQQLAVLPPEVSLDHAATLPIAALAALQALRDNGAVSPGASVLVWGASGGVGHFAVQIARKLGASRVDAVCSGRNAEMVRSLGADAVADYRSHETPPGGYDVIVDTVCTQSMGALKKLLATGGRVVTVGAVGGGAVLGPGGPVLRRFIAGAARRVPHSMIMAKITDDDLATVVGWVAEGAVRPVIARTVPSDHIRAALEELEAGHVAGKLVVDLTA